MRWGAQVGHVFAKDVRYGRWTIALYSVVVVATALQGYVQRASGGSLWPIAVVAFGAAIVAMALQSDSATRANAFWASRPLSPSAVLLSKFILVIGVVASIPAVAVFASMCTFGVSMGDAALLALSAAVSFALLLIPMMIVAAMTPDLRAFGMSAIATLGAAFIVSGFWVPRSLSDAVTHVSGRIAFAVVAIVAAVSLLMYLYRRREVHRISWVVAVLVTILVIPSWAGALFTSQDATREPRIDRPTLTLSIPQGHYSSTPPTVRLGVSAAGGDATVSYAVHVERMVVQLRDGTRFETHAFSWGDFARQARLPIGNNVALVGSLVDNNSGSVEIQISEQQRRQLGRGVVSYQLDGNVLVVRPRMISSAPFGDSQLFGASGLRGRLFEFSHDSAGVRGNIETSSPNQTAPTASYIRSPRDPSVVILNERAHQAIKMRSDGGTSGSGAWFVLPGVSMQYSHRLLRTETTAAQLDSAAIGDAWFQGGRVLVFEPETLGTYPVHLELTVPKP